jgi:hypothetical protein
VTPVIAAIMSALGVLVMLAIWHDAATLQAIRGSGGLAEDFTLPIMLALPGLVLGTIGGVAGRLASMTLRRH